MYACMYVCMYVNIHTCFCWVRFTEQEAAKLIRPLLESVAYLHDLVYTYIQYIDTYIHT